MYTPNYAARLARLAALSSGAADVITLVPGANMVYFTGLEFHLSERPIVAIIDKSGELTFILPQLEAIKLDVRPDLKAKVFVWNDVEGYQGAFQQAADALALGGKVLGADGLTMRLVEWFAFQQAAPGIRAVDVAHDLLDIRQRKESAEVEAMRQAIKVSERALSRLLHQVEPGMSEKEIAARLNGELTGQGSDGNAFAPLIQTGPNSALPHGMMTERELQEGEFFLVDFGGMKDGYPADITRTFCLGTPTEKMREMYDVVLRANQAAQAAAKPGVPCGVVDKAARDVIEAAGYGEYFIHRTGHGLGLSGHELPQIAAGVEAVLEPGMVFTIEPGIYVPGYGGVRIEDNVVVTETGIERLTSFPYGLDAFNLTS